MFQSILISLTMMVFTSLAMPQVGPYLPSSLSNATMTTSASNAMNTTTTPTFTVQTSTIQVTYSSSTESPSPTSPVFEPYVISAFKPDTNIHLLPMNAAGLKFWLGGEPATYCPTSIEQLGLCPSGDVTGFWGGCTLSALVPGGQTIYAAPDGSLGFTQAHSMYIPAGSEQCPMSIISNGNGNIFQVGVNAFDASGFMACPTTSITGDILWQVYIAIENATVTGGDVSECIPFYAVAAPYNLQNESAAAWQYT